MIGVKSGRVIAYGTRTKRCATCEAADRNAKKPRKHDYRLNWSGSSKNMEADVCVGLVQTCNEKHGAQVAISVGLKFLLALIVTNTNVFLQDHYLN